MDSLTSDTTTMVIDLAGNDEEVDLSLPLQQSSMIARQDSTLNKRLGELSRKGTSESSAFRPIPVPMSDHQPCKSTLSLLSNLRPNIGEFLGDRSTAVQSSQGPIAQNFPVTTMNPASTKLVSAHEATRPAASTTVILSKFRAHTHKNEAPQKLYQNSSFPFKQRKNLHGLGPVDIPSTQISGLPTEYASASKGISIAHANPSAHSAPLVAPAHPYPLIQASERLDQAYLEDENQNFPSPIAPLPAGSLPAKISSVGAVVAVPAKGLITNRDRLYPRGRYTKHDVATNILLALGAHPWLAPLNARYFGVLGVDISGRHMSANQQHARGEFLKAAIARHEEESGRLSAKQKSGTSQISPKETCVTE